MKIKLLFILLCFSVFPGVTYSQSNNNQKDDVYYDDWPVTRSTNIRLEFFGDGIQPNFVPLGTVWNHRVISYFFGNGTNDIDYNGEQRAIKDALDIWAEVTDLAFIEVCSETDADIVIQWAAGNHGDGAPFDGIGYVLAHNLGGPPPNYFGEMAADTHFDDAETWTLGERQNNAQPIDLVTVAAHEFGHALGLDHTKVAGSLMLANYSGSHRFLGSDDKDGIQSLYGEKPYNTSNIISGPKSICNSGTYSLENLPSNLNINWSVEGPLSINSNNTGETVDVSSTESGNGFLIATINSSCDEIIIKRV